jgi:arylsulfatase A-like enzyme
MSTPLSRREVLAGAPAFAPPGLRPNLLLITTDQQSVYALAANGNRDLATPAMDALAREGANFTESYATYPVCSPARSSIFTSRMPHETGVRDNGKPIVEGMPTMGEHFRAAGYETVYAGKWHLPQSFGVPRGFRQLYGGHQLGAVMDEPVGTAGVEFLTSKPREPFLMVTSFMNPHDVCSWIRAHPGRRPHEDTRHYPPVRPNMGVAPDEPEYIQHHRTSGYNSMSSGVGIASEWTATDFRHYLHDYYRLVEGVDRQIGRLVSALQTSGLWQNTLVLVTSDHGEGLGAHRWVQKAAFWEETVKVPMIVSGWGLKRRAVHNTTDLVSGLDILPTFCDYAGVAPPAGMRGRSLRGAIEGTGWDRRHVVSELSVFGDAGREGRMLRTRRFKYIVFNGGARPEQFFDLEYDPGEVNNLANQARAAGDLKEHRALLAGWMRETRDDFRSPL